jgi:hypothetical protein
MFTNCDDNSTADFALWICIVSVTLQTLSIMKHVTDKRAFYTTGGTVIGLGTIFFGTWIVASTSQAVCDISQQPAATFVYLFGMVVLFVSDKLIEKW